MLTPPDLTFATIATLLRDEYGLRAARATFLPLGADVNAAVYRVEIEDAGAAYFLKLKRGGFNDLELALPAWLRAHSVTTVMAALPTRAGALWASAHGYTWTLFPYFAGRQAYDLALTDAQWEEIGATLRAIHDAKLPPNLASRLERDDYSPRDRDRLRAWDARIAAETFANPIAARLAAFWLERRAEILQVVGRAEELAAALRARDLPRVLCHGDYHGWNILVDAHGDLAVVDWDTAIYSLPERDLMFAGANISGQWDDAREVALFYQGYGAPGPDPMAEAYYRYERIVSDLAVDAGEVFDARGGAENREQSYRIFTGQFAPRQDIALAGRAYERLG